MGNNNSSSHEHSGEAPELEASVEDGGYHTQQQQYVTTSSKTSILTPKINSSSGLMEWKEKDMVGYRVLGVQVLTSIATCRDITCPAPSDTLSFSLFKPFATIRVNPLQRLLVSSLFLILSSRQMVCLCGH